jgi:6-phosphofructokinase 1
LTTPSSPRRVGIIFSGGPAPAANAVIASAAVSFIDSGREVIGFFGGYSALQDYDPTTAPLIRDEHYLLFRERDVVGIRNERGIHIGTARSNPGKGISSPGDLLDTAKTERLRRVHQALTDLNIDALISIGGDDTLKTANLLFQYQKQLAEDAPRFAVVHLPKTIDNDYNGIDFTFGFFTAVDFMAKELLNLRADAIATRSWFVVETMGRKAGWLSYGVAIAGEANLVVGVEDLDESLCHAPGVLSLDKLSNLICDLIVVREERDKKRYGTVVLAEGLAERLPDDLLVDVPRDEHGHISLGKLDLGKLVAKSVAQKYQERSGKECKVKPIQLGYESRCAPAHAFDIMLGSQLGVGAFRALVEEGLDGHMVSVTGQLDLQYVPFSDLVDPETLVTGVRLIERGSDFHRLARFLETRMDRLPVWKAKQKD